MRLAVLSDVHANLVALDAVLRELEDEHIDGYACLGDMIQGGPQPAETVQRLRSLRCPIVMGNSDAWLLSGRMTGNEPFTEAQRERLEAGRQWSLAQLSQADRAFIASFTPTIDVDLGHGRSFLGFHGSPRDFDEFIFPSTAEAQFQEVLGAHSGRIMAGGHIHLQYVRRIADSFFFNPGSVGVAYRHEQPEGSFRLDPWAEYAVLSVDGERTRLEFRRAPMDVDEVVRVYRSSGRPHAETSISQYGRS
jgi:predicted phosphodiesterase